jgi:hypothetical protein
MRGRERGKGENEQAMAKNFRFGRTVRAILPANYGS